MHRTWTLGAGSGKVEFDGQSVDMSVTSAVIPPDTTIVVRVSGESALQLVETSRKE